MLAAAARASCRAGAGAARRPWSSTPTSRQAAGAIVDGAPAAAAAAAAAAAPPSLRPQSVPRTARLYKHRGPVADDPMPGRPLEDDIANCTLYFEALAGLWKNAIVSGDPEELEQAATAIVNRLARMHDPRNLVVALATLTQRRQVVPAAALAVEGRFLSSGGAAFADLDGHYLSSLAYSVAVQGGSNGAFWDALEARAVAVGAFEPHHLDNLASALARAGRGVPAGLERLPAAR